jgi:hypothetical protein
MKAAVGLLATLGTSALGWFLAWRAWRKRQDLGVIHFSQNTLEERPTGPDGQMERWLILDVYSENPLEEEISHYAPRRLIQKAAKRTTVQQPFLHFPKEDRWYVLNLIRLAIAEPFRTGTAAKLVEGAKVVPVECIFAVTFERYATMRQGKIRVMIVKRSDLDNPKAFDEPLRLESTFHRDRITTLRRMQTDYAKGEANWEYCLNVRINVQL